MIKKKAASRIRLHSLNLLCLFMFSGLHYLLLICAKLDTFPNLLGANIQYIEEYYNFSESYFYLFSNHNESAYCIKPQSFIRACLYFAFRRVDFVWLLMSNSELLQIINRKSGIGILSNNSYTAYIQRFNLYWIVA